jgi:transcriptional regulator with XRE-family HTH domain
MTAAESAAAGLSDAQGKDITPPGAPAVSFGTEMARLMQAGSVRGNELARMTGYTPGCISQLRSGKRNPSPDVAHDIDQALGAGGTLTALAAGKRSGAGGGPRTPGTAAAVEEAVW